MKPIKEFRSILPFTLLLVIVVFLSSCSMTFEKRLYRKGYHVEVIKNRFDRRGEIRETETSSSVESERNSPGVKNESENNEKQEQEVQPAVADIGASTSTKSGIDRKTGVKISSEKIDSGSDCDEILLKDGTKIDAAIISIGETDVVYKKCNFPDGPSYIVSNNKVDIIHLRNGDYFKPKSYSSTTTSYGKPSSGIGELVIGILALFFALFAFAMSFFLSYGGSVLAGIFGSAGFILGIVGTIMSAVKMTPENQSKTIPGLIMAALAIVLFMVIIAIMVLI